MNGLRQRFVVLKNDRKKPGTSQPDYVLLSRRARGRRVPRAGAADGGHDGEDCRVVGRAGGSRAISAEDPRPAWSPDGRRWEAWVARGYRRTPLRMTR